MPRPSIPCPFCRKQLASQTQGIWPFCSERCKALDLGAWAKEEYRVPAQPDSPDFEQLADMDTGDHDPSES